MDLFADLPIFEPTDSRDMAGPEAEQADTFSFRVQRKNKKEAGSGPMRVISHLSEQEAVSQTEIQLVLAFLGDRIAEIMKEQK